MKGADQFKPSVYNNNNDLSKDLGPADYFNYSLKKPSADDSFGNIINNSSNPDKQETSPAQV